MKPIKILHLITTVEEGKGIGGAENLLLSMLDKIDKSEFKFIVAYHLPTRLKKELGRTKVEQLFKEKGTEVELFATRSKFDLLAIIKLINLIREKNIDIVHAQQPRLDFLGSIAAKLAGVPVVITRHLSMARFPINRFKRQIYQLFDSLVTARLADKIITVSKEIASDLIKTQRVSPNKIKVIYNGIDPGKFSRQTDEKRSIRKEFKLGKCQLVGIIARINIQKSHQYFLEAVSYIVKIMPQVKFLIVGDGPLKADMEKLAKKLGIDSWVIFTGYRTDISQIISELDIIVLSSLTEGLPVVFLEAMAMSKPVVSFNVGGVSELVIDGQTGILVPLKDSSGLAKAIIKLLKNKEEATGMGMAGWKRLDEKFSLEQMVRGYEEVYVEIIESRNF